MWFLLIIITLFISPAPSLAQESSPSATPTAQAISTPSIDPAFAKFEQYKTDYKYSQDLYTQALIDYTQKKQTYTKYGTLTSQQEKIDATRKVLIARNNLLRTYLTALRVDLDKYKQINTSDTDKIQIDIQKWESWLNEQNSIVSAYNNDDDIRRWSGDFNTKYISIQQTLYTALVIHQSNFKLKILTDINDLANDIKNSPKSATISDNWLGNLTIKSDNVNTSLKAAYDASQTKQNIFRFNNFYSTSKKELTKASQYLSDILSDLRSIVIKFND